MDRSWVFWMALFFVFGSCRYVAPNEQKKPLARVNQSYLYYEDIGPGLLESVTAQDSSLIIQNQITRWATKQLLIDQAKINISPEQQADLEDLIQQYRTDLFTEYYKSSIVAAQLDSIVTEAELEQYYAQNKENFKLNDVVMQFRYVHLPENYLQIPEVKSALQRFDQDDKILLEELSLQFIGSYLNDSTWVRQEKIIERLPILKESNMAGLKNAKITQLQDSLGLYLLKIVSVLDRNDPAPLTYVTPTIRQIILNRRKQELTNKLEKDITKDAIRNKTFEIYTPN
ncbi:MAG: peptidyl-prolyl cis-trans isomerase [Flavobacteriaceae bacterium]|nr:peptidyl-prolyl cis-trans isomerase [Flavobacteriaceae bacterium]MDG1961510.1 peptidyl-prolyl cis-trans isomerase [Flavobacteriaceae bacterium]